VTASLLPNVGVHILRVLSSALLVMTIVATPGETRAADERHAAEQPCTGEPSSPVQTRLYAARRCRRKPGDHRPVSVSVVADVA
jgi:hypothetical protein